MEKIEGGGSFSVDAETGAVTANHIPESGEMVPPANDGAPAPVAKPTKVTPIKIPKE